MWNSTMETRGTAELDQEQEPGYVFKESGRRLQKARDNKLVERKTAVYGPESDAGKTGKNGKTGNSED